MNLIFDFDGTLVDSFDCMFTQFNRLAEEFNFPKINRDEIKHLKDLSSVQIIEHLQIPLYKLPRLILQVRKYMRAEIKNLQPIPGLPLVLQKLHSAGCMLGILTSNSRENVELWLEQQNMRLLFNFVKTEFHFFSKKNSLRKIVTSLVLDRTKTFYIGDETRDVIAAKKSSINSIAVAWGFNSEKALLQSQPNYLIYKPEELLTILHPL